MPKLNDKPEFIIYTYAMGSLSRTAGVVTYEEKDIGSQRIKVRPPKKTLAQALFVVKKLREAGVGFDVQYVIVRKNGFKSKIVHIS